jgi:hypothetical protein
MTRGTRIIRTVALGALVVAAIVVLPTSAPAAGSSRAVVNVGGSNHVVTFDGSTSGIAALQMAAGVEIISYGGQGVAVCRINGVGNPPIPGECLGEASGQYWSYWRAAPGAGGFSYSGGGAGGTLVTDGAVEGWSFGSGSPPPFSSFCAVAGCAPPAPPPTVAPIAPPIAPPAAPPTARPTSSPAVAGSSGSSSTGGSAAATTNETKGSAGNQDPGKEAGKGSGSAKNGDSNAPDQPDSGSGSASESSDGGTGRGANERDGQQAAGPVVSREDEGGSPWGVAAAAGAFAALGAGGYVVRKRRRLPLPLD